MESKKPNCNKRYIGINFSLIQEEQSKHDYKLFLQKEEDEKTEIGYIAKGCLSIDWSKVTNYIKNKDVTDAQIEQFAEYLGEVIIKNDISGLMTINKASKEVKKRFLRGFKIANRFE